MKDYRTQVDEKTVSNILNFFIGNDYDIHTIEGTLMDSYLIEVNNDNLKLGRVKLRKYMIIAETYINEWTSVHDLILTDNEALFNKYLKIA